MSGRSCAFRGCQTRSGEGISMFGFPKDPERAKIWINACFRNDLLKKVTSVFKSYTLCERHFEKDLILEGPSKKSLIPEALPKLFPNSKLDITFERNKEVPTEEPTMKVIFLSDEEQLQNDDSTNEPSLDNTTTGKLSSLSSALFSHATQVNLVKGRSSGLERVCEDRNGRSFIQASQHQHPDDQNSHQIICADGVVSEDIYVEKLDNSSIPNGYDREEEISSSREQDLCFDDFDEADMEDEIKAKLFWKIAVTTLNSYKKQNIIYRKKLHMRKKEIDKLRAALRN